MSISINNFPDELLINIFSHLEPKELAGAALVSKKWNALSCDNSLWESIIKRIPLELEYDENGIKHNLSRIKKINTYPDLIEDFKTFSESIEPDQNAYYRCLFLRNPSCYLNIKFGVINHPTKATKVVRQVLFTKQLAENGALIYGTGKEKNIEARLPSKYTLKEIKDHGDDTIISVMRYLYDQIRKTEFGLLLYESSTECQNNASYFATAFTISSVAIFIFGLAAYRNLYI